MHGSIRLKAEGRVLNGQVARGLGSLQNKEHSLSRHRCMWSLSLSHVYMFPKIGKLVVVFAFQTIQKGPPMSGQRLKKTSRSRSRFKGLSLATLFRFLKEILPVSSSSKSRKALRISSFLIQTFVFWKKSRGRVTPSNQISVDLGANAG